MVKTRKEQVQSDLVPSCVEPACFGPSLLFRIRRESLNWGKWPRLGKWDLGKAIDVFDLLLKFRTRRFIFEED